MRIFCSICKDIYFPCSEVHVTNCGHLYHGSCISTWIKQHRTCPQCRASLSQPFRIYFDVEKGEETDRATLERHVEVLVDKLREAEKYKRKLLEENKNLEKIAGDMKECACSLTEKNNILRVSVNALKEEVTRLTRKNKVVTRLEDEVESLKSKVSVLERVEMLIKGSAEEVNKMMESTPITEMAVKQLCTYVGVLKDQLKKIETKNVKLFKENRDISRALAEEKQKNFNGTEELIKSLTVKNKKLENDLNSLNVLFEEYKKKHSKKVKSLAPLHNSASSTVQGPSKKNFLDINLDALFEEENESPEVVPPIESDRAIKHWEEMVCAGPIRTPFSKTRSFGTALCDEDNNGTPSFSAYAYDGLGGRKKVRLGGPTPVEEFEKLKQKKVKKGAQTFQHRKIYEYFQMDNEN